jgi:hypothetical protein
MINNEEWTELYSHNSVEELAKVLHANYRAAFKAMNRCHVTHTPNANGHDHGWKGCNRKDYFRQRAKRILSQ